MILNQIFDSINLGIIVLDRGLNVQKWNRWMEIHSGTGSEKIIGRSIFEFFPELNNQKFLRSCKSVFTFGNFCFFSQKLHGYLFPFSSGSYVSSEFEFMQQSCAMGPLRGDNNTIDSLFIYVQDVTEVAVYEGMLKELNMKDSLTGIYNRRYLESKLNDEFIRHKRYSGNLSIIMFDIDHFKRVNDEYGHQCGDFILKSLSSRISSLIRNVDCLARYGGEEFCSILPETGLNNALIVAERFRTAIVEQENHYNGMVVKVTISLGVAEIREGIQSAEQLLNKADEAMYHAKRTGRNRVVGMLSHAAV